VLDAFAGSGALGFEALSRGAARTVFIEHDARASRVLEQNAASLRVPDDEWELRRGDAIVNLRDASARGETYSLVLCDPPYRLAAGLGGPLSEALAPLLTPGARVVTESDRRDPLPLTIPLVDERRYGDTLIRIHSHES
jgi:16S rRNA (guanine966-N2)-methyltransferase